MRKRISRASSNVAPFIFFLVVLVWWHMVKLRRKFIRAAYFYKGYTSWQSWPIWHMSEERCAVEPRHNKVARKCQRRYAKFYICYKTFHSKLRLSRGNRPHWPHSENTLKRQKLLSNVHGIKLITYWRSNLITAQIHSRTLNVYISSTEKKRRTVHAFRNLISNLLLSFSGINWFARSENIAVLQNNRLCIISCFVTQ